ncbi:hypothetical protein BUALT_Bualt14G0022100 [Buddleja alternifolia]|uniref:Uncharacterized protein n=1 Tax=Buddleja alternifolia TaxID=168488 RepID=A0AAV6WR83_9LAMI|nr:hypothetical protein BUALT_Bualt14G0022100 [Buddleja alternifolia]
MVRCMLKRKVYEIWADDEETEYGGGLKCMKNGVIYYAGADNVLEAEARREMRAAAWATKTVEDDFDDAGRARLKIVYVDSGPLSSGSKASKHIDTIVKAEKEKEKKEGRRGPRLIFVKQDRDYWPGSETDDPDVMLRRAAKEKSMPRPYVDHRDIYVPPLPEEEEKTPAYFADSNARKVYRAKRFFMRYLDPSMPGTKFILDSLPPSKVYSVINEYKEDPDLWKEWMRVSSQQDGKPALNRISGTVNLRKEQGICASQVDWMIFGSIASGTFLEITLRITVCLFTNDFGAANSEAKSASACALPETVDACLKLFVSDCSIDGEEARIVALMVRRFRL